MQTSPGSRKLKWIRIESKVAVEAPALQHPGLTRVFVQGVVDDKRSHIDGRHVVGIRLGFVQLIENISGELLRGACTRPFRTSAKENLFREIGL